MEGGKKRIVFKLILIVFFVPEFFEISVLLLINFNM